MSNMELWYTENQTNNVNFSMKVKSHLYSKAKRLSKNRYNRHLRIWYRKRYPYQSM